MILDNVARKDQEKNVEVSGLVISKLDKTVIGK